jgi:hypothetical protein
MTWAHCEDCGRRRRLGDGVRTYEVANPIMVVDVKLCWKCYLKQVNKERKHTTIKDKLHVVR